MPPRRMRVTSLHGSFCISKPSWGTSAVIQQRRGLVESNETIYRGSSRWACKCPQNLLNLLELFQKKINLRPTIRRRGHSISCLEAPAEHQRESLQPPPPWDRAVLLELQQRRGCLQADTIVSPLLSPSPNRKAVSSPTGKSYPWCRRKPCRAGERH